MTPPSGVPNVCQWLGRTAFQQFATFTGATQSQAHIKPVHWYVASRLVVEGGFHPDDVRPRPPFEVRQRGREKLLVHAPELATGGEHTVLGGLKTKDVDVVVAKPGMGPVIAVSCRGMTGALRNLTNRMEETIGECTNIHITYPALVFGYLFLIRANQIPQAQEVTAELEKAVSESALPTRQLAANDIALQLGGEPVESIRRFYSALLELHGRRGIRNDISRYEAIALALIDTGAEKAGTNLSGFPQADSPLRFEQLFSTIYLRYDERFVYAAPTLKSVTERIEWSPDSPAFQPSTLAAGLDYEPRLV